MNKLKGIMREKGVTQQQLANGLGISIQALNAKMNGRSEFTISEAIRVCVYLNITDPSTIFFSPDSSKMQQVEGKKEA